MTKDRKQAIALGFVVLSWCASSAVAYSQTASPERSSPAPAMDQALHDACSKKVVLLGEPPVLGFGRVLDFKAELTRRLINECHFNALFFESGIYDFLNIEKARQS